jgi:hypothetical protein
MIGGTIFGEPSVDYHYHVISQPFSIIAIAHPPTTFDHTPKTLRSGRTLVFEEGESL